MNLAEFERLSLKKKAELVLLEQGHFIGSRTYYNQRLVLYDMGDFFAEIWYEPDANQILNVTSLSSGDPKVDLYIKANRSDIPPT